MAKVMIECKELEVLLNYCKSRIESIVFKNDYEKGKHFAYEDIEYQIECLAAEVKED